jgi:hypothetical protein
MIGSPTAPPKPLGCSVTLAPGLLLATEGKGGRDNLDKRKIQTGQL